MTAALATLNPAAQVALASCEQRIERGLKTFIDVGQALAEIRDSRLYKGSHSSFEDYCRERWGFSRVRAHQLTSAADLALTMVNSGLPEPTNERQARALASVPESDRADVWRQVSDSGDKPTAEAIRKAAEVRIQPPDPGPTGAALSPPADPASPAPAVVSPAPAAPREPGPTPEPGAGGDLRDHVLAVLRPDEDDAWGLDDICSRLPGFGEPGQVRPGEVREVLAVLVEAGLAGTGRDSDGPYWWKAVPTPTPPSAHARTPEQREQMVADAERTRAINHARRIADRLVREVSGFITEIEQGAAYGEPGLITAAMVVGLREQADRLERHLKEQQ
jgi:hypothetical protein